MELRLTAAFRAIKPTNGANVWLTAKTHNPVGKFNPVVDGNAQSRQSGRHTHLYGYYHGTVTVFSGDGLYIRGRAVFGTPVPGRDSQGTFLYSGFHYPVGPYDWLMCKA